MRNEGIVTEYTVHFSKFFPQKEYWLFFVIGTCSIVPHKFHVSRSSAWLIELSADI